MPIFTDEHIEKYKNEDAFKESSYVCRKETKILSSTYWVLTTSLILYGMYVYHFSSLFRKLI